MENNFVRGSDKEDSVFEEQNVIMNWTLKKLIFENAVCRTCGGKVTLTEDISHREGLGKKLSFNCEYLTCSNEKNSFFTIPKFPGKNSYKINMLSNLTMRVIGKVRSAALKLFISWKGGMGKLYKIPFG